MKQVNDLDNVSLLDVEKRLDTGLKKFVRRDNKEFNSYDNI